MAANTLTRGRLRRLADVHPARGRVLSVFMNLDPSELPTPAARSSAVTSVLTEAAHRVDEQDGLDHEERAAGVGSSEGSRFMNTERTRPRAGCTSASRRRRPRVSVFAAMREPYPTLERPELGATR